MKQLGELGEHQTSEGHEVQGSPRGGEALVVPGQAAEARRLGKLRSTTQRRGSKTKPRLAAGGLTTLSWMPWAAAAGSSPV